MKIMNHQVNELVMNASDEIMAGPDGAQRSPEEEQKFRKQRLAAALRIFGKFGLISFDYSTNNYKGLYLSGDNFSQENLFFDNQLRRADAMRFGTEWRINNLSVRGGYVFEQSPFINSISSDNLESYSLGLGYNFGTVKLNLSYRKSNKTDQYDFYPQYNEVEATQLNINNTIITIGFSANI